MSNNDTLLFRSSHLEIFCRKGVLRNFAKFTGKPLCQSLFLNKVAVAPAPHPRAAPKMPILNRVKNDQVSLYYQFNKIIKGPGTSYQSPALS